MSTQLAATKESLNHLEADFKQAVAEKDSLLRQLTSSEADLRSAHERLEAGATNKAALEARLAQLDAKLSASTMEVTSLRLLKESLDGAEKRLAVVASREEIAEREEEHDMGQRRLYRHSSARPVVRSLGLDATDGEAKADAGVDAGMFDFDIAFQFESQSPSAAGECQYFSFVQIIS